MASCAKEFVVMLLAMSVDAVRPNVYTHQTSVLQEHSNSSNSVWDSDDHIFEDDAHSLDAHSLAVPPKEQVDAAIAAANGHAEMTSKLALETHGDITKEMEAAVRKGEMVDMNTIKRLNEAISRDRTAKELVSMTEAYTEKVNEFFETIDRRSKSMEQRAASQQALDAEQKAEELRLSMIKETKAAEHAASEEAKQAALAALEQSEQELEQTLQEQKQAMAELKNSHNLQEVLEAEKLIELYRTIQEHDKNIGEKDATIQANIHPTVRSATKSVQDWANCQVRPFCKKFRFAEVVTQTIPQANCRQAMQILIPIAKEPSGHIVLPSELQHSECKIEEGKCQCN